jgi:hypothetical protein
LPCNPGQAAEGVSEGRQRVRIPIRNGKLESAVFDSEEEEYGRMEQALVSLLAMKAAADEYGHLFSVIIMISGWRLSGKTMGKPRAKPHSRG